MRGPDTGDSGNLKEETYLPKKTRERIPFASERQSGTRNRLLMLHFCNSGGSIALEDKEITPAGRIEGIRVRPSFKLAGRISQSKLEI